MSEFCTGIKTYLTPKSKKEYINHLFGLLYIIPICELVVMFFRPGPLLFQRISRPLMFVVDYVTTTINYTAFLITFLAWGVLAWQAKKFRCPWVLIIGAMFIVHAINPMWSASFIKEQTVFSYLLTKLPYPVDLVLSLTNGIQKIIYQPLPFIDTYLRANYDSWIRVFFAVYFESLCIFGYLNKLKVEK